MAARGTTLAAWAVCTTCALSAAAAEPTPGEIVAARDLFSKAEQDEDAGRWDAALEKLRRAVSVKATAGLQFHIGLCEEKLGQLTLALKDYTASEARAREEGNKDVLDAVMDPLASLRARVPTLTVTVAPNSEDAAVTVDGAVLPPGLRGTTVRMELGRHVIVATAAAHTPFSVTVNLGERDAKIVDVRLAPVPVAVTAPPPLPSELAPVPPPPGSSRAGALVATGGAVALVGLGVASFLVAGNRQSAAQAQCREEVDCNDLKSPIRAFDWLALGAWVGGAAVGTVAVILWARPSGPPGKTSAELRVGPASLGFVSHF
jgi:hypothetical protein